MSGSHYWHVTANDSIALLCCTNSLTHNLIPSRTKKVKKKHMGTHTHNLSGSSNVFHVPSSWESWKKIGRTWLLNVPLCCQGEILQWPHAAQSHALFVTHGVQTQSFNPFLKCSLLRPLLNVLIVMNRMSVERSKATVACLHSGPDLNLLCPVGTVGGFLMFWCRAALHSPWLPVFLNSASIHSLKPSEGLPAVFFTQRGILLQGNRLYMIM